MNEQIIFSAIDIVGTFVFAISGAAAASQRRLDIFGIVFLAFIAACGGGILRDVMIGATPPTSLINVHYIAWSVTAAISTVICWPLFHYLKHPVLLFDAIGLSLFCVVGAQKTLLYTGSATAAVFLGMVTAVGGGVLRDMILNRIPLILSKEIYALAALIGSIVFVSLEQMRLLLHWHSWLAMLVCFSLRMLALHFQWHLFRPVYK